MVNLKGSKTEKNLLIAFSGESQAANRYAYYAKVAKKEGYVQISTIFARTAEQERAHAKMLLKLSAGGEVEITAAYPMTPPGSTVENLENALQGEEHESLEMYPRFAGVAEEEGFPMIAAVLRSIAVAEEQHARTYRAFLGNIRNGTVFARNEAVVWYCSKCGFVHKGGRPPQKCPACSHSQAYFELLAENW